MDMIVLRQLLQVKMMRYNERCRNCKFEANDWMPCEDCKKSGTWYWYAPKNLTIKELDEDVYYGALCEIADITNEYSYLLEQGKSWDWDEPIDRINKVLNNTLHRKKIGDDDK